MTRSPSVERHANGIAVERVTHLLTKRGIKRVCRCWHVSVAVGKGNRERTRWTGIHYLTFGEAWRAMVSLAEPLHLLDAVAAHTERYHDDFAEHGR